ncbi:MAG: cupredoxin domain-containing protein [Limisphaerales bacterium]
MNKRVAWHLLCLIAAWLLLPALQIRAETFYVGWDSDNGFSPSAVTINLGDTVVWTDNDPDFPTEVTSDNSFGQPNYFQFSLVNQGDIYGVTFNSTGTIGYSETFGATGSVTIINSMPVSITLSSPRLAGGQFLFDATGLISGKTNVLEISTNLSGWTTIETNVATGDTATFTNSIVSGSQFYRVAQLP